MASKPTAEFRAEAVRIALTSGLSRRQVAADLGLSVVRVFGPVSGLS